MVCAVYCVYVDDSDDIYLFGTLHLVTNWCLFDWLLHYDFFYFQFSIISFLTVTISDIQELLFGLNLQNDFEFESNVG